VIIRRSIGQGGEYPPVRTGELVMIVMALRRGAKSIIGEARFGKCRLTITPPEFIKGEKKINLAGEDPPDPLLVPLGVAAKNQRSQES
jgi:hypothetical protein